MIRLAEARFAASIMISCSMIESLTGGQCVWMMKTSEPRIDSSKRQWISPTGKSRKFAAPSSVFSSRAMASASPGCDRPENSSSRRCGTSSVSGICYLLRRLGSSVSRSYSLEKWPGLGSIWHLGAGGQIRERPDVGFPADGGALRVREFDARPLANHRVEEPDRRPDD